MNNIKKGDLVTLSMDGLKSLENDRMSIYERVNLTRLQTNGGQVISLYTDYAKIGIFDPERSEIIDHWILEQKRIAQL
ncbi:hypothetical protein [Fusibacter sp. 3D3]|uniref:hypothetical protein n=1 Tax=Fusibacter sp. 3D3 TaxID=1048380 RepID=UPI0008536ADA|nr:hypothetical protein [Fusibacter sp. 3D3]GAU77619.1 hypothetical protein F3D3_2248 [Fusibacter sp. 3D3]